MPVTSPLRGRARGDRLSAVLQPFDQAPTPAWDSAYPWNRQPCDAEDRWPLFRGWLALGPLRDLGSYAVSVGIVPATLQRMAKDCFWIERAKAYDAMVHASYNASVIEHVVVHAREQAERHIRMLDNALEIAEIEFARLLEETKARTMSGTMKPRDLIRLTEACLKLRLLLAGEATERIDIKDIEGVLRSMPADQLEALQALQGRLLCGKLD